MVMIGLEPIWNVSIKAFLCVTFGGFSAYSQFSVVEHTFDMLL